MRALREASVSLPSGAFSAKGSLHDPREQSPDSRLAWDYHLDRRPVVRTTLNLSLTTELSNAFLYPYQAKSTTTPSLLGVRLLA